MLTGWKRLAAAGLAALGALSGSAAAETIKFAHVYEVDTPYHRAALAAAEEIKARTSGRYEVQVFPAGQLGREQDLFQGLKLGSIDMTFTGSFYAGGMHGPMALSSAPFMFRDYEHWKRYSISDLFKEIAGAFEAKTSIKVLGLVYYGARHLTSNKPIRAPEDMKGMKLRVPSTPMYLLFPKSVGANAVPIDFAEVYVALQQGTADGQENPLPTILAKKFYEVQKYITLTGHVQDSLVLLASPTLWAKLSDDDKAIFAEVYAKAALATSDAVYQYEQELAKAFETKYGVTVLTVDREPFRREMLKLTTGPDMPWTKEQVDRVLALQ